MTAAPRTDRAAPDIALRQAREAVRRGELAEAWERAHAILTADPGHEAAAALAGAVTRRWRGALRGAVSHRRHGEAVDLGLLLLRADVFVADAVGALASSAPAILQGDDLFATLSACIGDAGETSPLWDALADALLKQPPTPDALEAGFSALARMPGHPALIEALDDAVARFGRGGH